MRMLTVKWYSYIGYSEFGEYYIVPKGKSGYRWELYDGNGDNTNPNNFVAGGLIVSSKTQAVKKAEEDYKNRINRSKT